MASKAKTPETPLAGNVQGGTLPVRQVGALVNPASQGVVGQALGEVGAGLGRVSDDLAARAEELRRRRTTLDVISALSEMTDNETAFLSSQMAKKGRDVEGVLEEAANFYDNAEDELASRFRDNPDGLEAVQRAMLSRRASGIRSLATHQRNEMHAWTLQTAEASILSIEQAVAQNPGVLDHVNTLIAEGLDGIDAMFPGENNQPRKRAFLSGIRATQISRAAVDDPQLAEALLKEHKSEIFPDQVAKLERVVEAARREQAMFDLYHEAMRAGGGDHDRAAMYLMDLKNKPADMDFDDLRQVINMHKSDGAYQRAMIREAKEKRREEGRSVLADAMMNDKISAQLVRDVSTTYGFSASDKTAWMSALEGYATNKESSYASIYYKEGLARIYTGQAETLEDVQDIVPYLTGPQLKTVINELQSATRLPPGAVNFVAKGQELAMRSLGFKKTDLDEEKLRIMGDFTQMLETGRRARGLDQTDPAVLDLAEMLLEKVVVEERAFARDVVERRFERWGRLKQQRNEEVSKLTRQYGPRTEEAIDYMLDNGVSFEEATNPVNIEFVLEEMERADAASR